MPAAKTTWRFIDDGARTGRSNMARDEALAVCASGGSLPCLRVYRFEPAAVTLGRSQPLPGAIDLAVCRARGIELVRRPTGGLAILHLDDFTYSITAGMEVAGGARERVFQTAAAGIIEALRLLGARASAASHPPTARAAVTWCFESGFGVDLECAGRKICGSAQRQYQASVLQHGSLFLADHADVLEELSGPGPDAGHGPPVSLAEQIGRSVGWGEVRDAFREGFGRALGIKLMEDSVNGEEEKVAEGLLAARYGSDGWSWPSEEVRL